MEETPTTPVEFCADVARQASLSTYSSGSKESCPSSDRSREPIMLGKKALGSNVCCCQKSSNTYILKNENEVNASLTVNKFFAKCSTSFSLLSTKTLQKKPKFDIKAVWFSTTGVCSAFTLTLEISQLPCYSVRH